MNLFSPTDNSLKRSEAISALEEGKRLKHNSFTTEEWVQQHSSGKGYVFEDGCRCTTYEFWSHRRDEGFDEGWFVAEVKTDIKVDNLPFGKSEALKFKSKVITSKDIAKIKKANAKRKMKNEKRLRSSLLDGII